MNKLLQALLVELDIALDDCLDLAVHDRLVRLAEDRNEEVKCHQIEYEDEHAVKGPDEDNHKLRVNFASC